MTMFVKHVLDRGGSIHPIIMPLNKTNGTGIFNPSIYYDSDVDKLYINIRHCQVTLYHSELGRFESFWGPLHYCHPENDLTLTTTNYFGELNKKTLEPEYITKVDFLLDVEPIWNFVGLEDSRIVKWNNTIYLSGVRRDTTTNGVGRIELTGLDLLNSDKIVEVSRNRLQPPFGDSYCEKNWMPVVDKDWHYIKWCNPTELVEADLHTNKTSQKFHGKEFPYQRDFRGGSQVIPLDNNYRFACVHTVNLFKSEQKRKNAVYRHCFIVWDKDWNVVNNTSEFTFLDSKIEFCAGMTKYNDDFLVTFGYQDNASYVLRVPKDVMEEICLK